MHSEETMIHLQHMIERACNGHTGEEKEKILQNAFKFSKVPVCVNNYEYIYDFSNKVTVCHDKYFNELTAKLFSNEVYSNVFYEDIETTGEKEC